MFTLLRIAIITAVVGVLLTPRASAATAVYIEPETISSEDLTALSTSGDNAGLLLRLNVKLSIILDDPVGATPGGTVSVFTIAPSVGAAGGGVRVGKYNGGSPQFVATKTGPAGGAATFNNLFDRGCGLLGGCDYIEMITAQTQGGAEGIVIDYIEVDGEVVEVASPTPEPSAWAMMIVGFAVLALRVKSLRRARKKGLRPPPERSRLKPTIRPAFS